MKVHKVDKDNLPKGLVLAFNGVDVMVGWLEAQYGSVHCDYEAEFLYDVTHYILEYEVINYFKQNGTTDL